MGRMAICCSTAALMVSGLILGPILVGEAQAQNIDHYQCYKAKELKGVCQEDLTAKCKTDADCQTVCLQKFTSRNVSLSDQLGTGVAIGEVTEVKKPKSLCTPVEKVLPGADGPAPQDPALHYKRYQIKGGPSVKGLRVLARDQFGDHVIELTKEDSLLVPASKSDVAVGPPPPGSDHYLCYKAKNKKKTCTDDLTTKCKADADCTQGGICDLGFGKVPQGLMDQFGTSTVEIKKVKFFCTPAEKDNENGGNGPFNPIDHLVGYQIKGSGITATVHTNDQFGAEALALSKQEILLVPALKNPGVGPICGNDTVEGTEQCDGTDDAACPGQCIAQGQPDECTCPAPPGCGNNIREGAEQCDGTDATACPGQCQANCTCPLVCGDTFPVCDGPCPNPGEECVNTGTACECIEPPLIECCDTFPVCDQPCPNPSDECVNTGGECECIPPELIECCDTFPVCDGPCPIQSDECVPTGGACECIPPMP